MKTDRSGRSPAATKDAGNRTGRAAGSPRVEKHVPYNAPALEKGLDILEMLADATAGMSQNQIAAQLGRSVGEIFRMLDVLERRAWLYRSATDSTYRLSMRMFELAHRHPQIKHLVSVALPPMHELSRGTRQSNHLVVHHDRRILVVAQVDSPEAMGFSVRIGAHFPFRLDRVSARTLSAFQPAHRRDELIQEMIDNDPSPLPRARLQKMVAAIAARGYEVKESATLPGITDICCPIFDQSGFAVATLTQPYLRQRDVTSSIEQSCEAQLRTVRLISKGLGAAAAAGGHRPFGQRP